MGFSFQIGKIMHKSSKLILIKLLLIIGLFNISFNAFSRPTLGPPSIQLRSNLANIIVSEYIGKDANSKLQFKKIKDLHNEEPENIVTINTNQDYDAQLTIGKTYIIAYISWYATEQPRKVYKRPEGAVFQNITGAQPSIYKYSKSVEKLITWDIDKTLTSPKEMLPIIMNAIDNQDQQIQDFFITEIITRKNIHKWMKKEDFEKVFQVMKSPLTSPKVRQFVIREALFLKSEISDDRYCQVLKDILMHTSTQMNPTSYTASMIRATFANIADCENFKQTELDSVSRWVLSNNRSVIESALETINKLQPQLTKSVIDQALDQTLLLKATKETLIMFQKRLK